MKKKYVKKKKIQYLCQKKTNINLFIHTMKKIISLFSLLVALLVTIPSDAQKAKGTFEAGNGTFLLNGNPFVVKAAEIHYPRIPKPYWEHRIKMCKALGMNTVCIYIFWNIHEQREGQFDFTGNNDVA